MATVHIPRHMQNAADGHASVEVPGGQLSSVIEALLQEHPSLRSMLMVEGSIRSDISIAINSAMTDNGLLVADLTICEQNNLSWTLGIGALLVDALEGG